MKKKKSVPRFSVSVCEDGSSSDENQESRLCNQIELAENLQFDRTSNIEVFGRLPSLPMLSVHSSRPRFDKFQYKVKNISDIPLQTSEVLRADVTDLVIVCEKTGYEKIDESTDIFPLLQIRKAVRTILLSLQIICKLIVTNVIYEYLIILVILFNTFILALDSAIAYDFSGFDIAFVYIYTVEFGLKIIGLGVVRKKNSYFRDYWNILDFTILVLAWVGELSRNALNLSAVRILRILRIFRSISSIEGLRIIFLALIGSVTKLTGAIILLFLLCFVFAVGGVQLFMGLLRNQCMELNTGAFNGDICGAKPCPSNYVCANSLKNPNYGNTSFDNSAYALLIVFQCITLEGWSDVLKQTSDAFGAYSALFFIPMTFIGAFILINLSLAIIKANFTKTMNELKRRPVEKWTEDKLLKEFANGNEDGFVEIDLSEQSTYFGNIRKMQEKMSLAPFISEACDENISQISEDSENSDEESISDRAIRRSSKFSIIERKRISVLIEKKVSDGLDDTVIAENNNRRRSSFHLRQSSEIKTMAKIKLRLLEKFRNGEQNKNFKITITNQNNIISESIEDLRQKSPKIEVLKQYNYSSYEFTYFVPGLSLFEKRKEKQMIYCLSKYGKSQHEVFRLLKNWVEAKSAFSRLILSVHQFIEKVGNKYRIDQKVCGEWSGPDVNPEKILDVSHLSFTTYRVWHTGLYGSLEKLLFPVKLIINSKAFSNLMIIIVLINTAILSVDHYGITQSSSNILNTFNTVLTILFAIEVFLKVLANGIRSFSRDNMNLFDLFVVVLSVIELFVISGSSSKISAFRAVRVFRTFRVLRVARMFRYVQSLFKILRAISSSLSKFIYLFLLLLLFIVIFSLIGVQIFAGEFDFPDGVPRSNFDDFHNSFVTIWQLLTMENWQGLLYDTMRSTAGSFSFFFLIVWIVIGNFVLLNLFLAILLDSFTEDAENITEQRRLSVRQSVIIDAESSEEELLKTQTLEILFENITCFKSYFIFSKSSLIRVLCYKISSSNAFENCILGMILLSSIKLVWDTYILNYPADSIEQVISLYIDIFFTTVFLIEYLVKSISMGFVLNPGCYLKDNWNKIDFTIAILSLIDLSTSSINIPSIKVLRLLRTFRPLRLLSHNVSMKIVVTAMIESLTSICNVVVVLLLFGLIFAILGVSLFAGMLYTCENPNITTQSDCIFSGYNWVNSDYNFDNVYEAGITLFILSSQEGWPDIMHFGMDAVAPGVAPRVNYNPPAAYYFIVYVLLGSFFFLNLFIAVIFEKFTEAKLMESSLIAQGLTKEQQLWVEMQRFAVQSKPKINVYKPPKSLIRRKIFEIITSTAFEWSITIFIILNLFQLSVYYLNASDFYITVLNYFNYALSSIFILEAVLKIIGLGFTRYIKSNWNKFDLFTVLMSIAGILSENLAGGATGNVTLTSQIIRIVRVVRIVRVLKVVKFLASLEEILNVISYSLPAILNVMSLLMLIYFIYSVLGVFAFNNVTEGLRINEYFNFVNFHSAMVTLYRISTGEDWYLIMYDCARVNGKTISLLYFCSFVTITTFLLLNLFIMVILQNYEDYEKNPESPLTLFNKHIKDFRKAWELYSFQYHGLMIHYKDLSSLLYSLGNELGVASTVSNEKVMRLMVALQLNIDENGYIYYNDMLYIVLKRMYRKRFRDSIETQKLVQKEEKLSIKLLKKIQKKSKSQFLSEEKQLEFKGTNLFFSLLYVKTVFKSWKHYVANKQNLDMCSEIDYPGDNSLISD